jgi:hypothetical protein
VGIKRIRANGLFEILEPEQPKVSGIRSNGSADQIIDGFRQDHPTWDTVFLQSCCNVHPITEYIKFGCYQIAEMHRYAQRYRCARVIVFDLLGDDLPLHRPRPFDRIMRTRKFGENTVSRRLDEIPTALLGLGTDHFI